jgi:hypothetical protein
MPCARAQAYTGSFYASKLNKHIRRRLVVIAFGSCPCLGRSFSQEYFHKPIPYKVPSVVDFQFNPLLIEVLLDKKHEAIGKA